MPENAASLPDFTRWPSFPFEGDMRVKDLAAPVAVEPPRSGEDASDCVACNTPDDAYIWENERWRVRAMDRPTGLPMVLILECRSHLDMGDLPNLLAAELGVMTVRLERAIRSLDGVARVHVNRWGDGSAHLHMWFLARPYGRLQLRGTFLSLWDDILPTIPEDQWRENLALVAAWLAEFGGHANTEPAHIQWQSPSTFSVAPMATGPGTEYTSASSTEPDAGAPTDSGAAGAPTDFGAAGAPTDSGAAGAPTDFGAADASAGSGRADALADSGAAAESESGKFADGNPAVDGDPGSANNDSDPAEDAGRESTGTSLSGPSGDGSVTGSGSDHGSSADDESAAGAATSEATLEAALGDRDHLRGDESSAEASPTSTAAKATADSEGAGEHPHGSEDSASVWVADTEKGLWRPSDLEEAERPAPNASTSPAAEATIENTYDRQAPPRGSNVHNVSGDGNTANPVGGQSDASSETAGIQHS